MGKKEEYLFLLSKTYSDAVNILLDKYGAAEDHYFREKSYERFFRGEIKNITKGNYLRSAEGLECHHIDENKFLNMTNTCYIKSQQIPFKYHKKERLVFCDIVEHTILHALIAKETSFEFGYPGYEVFLSHKVKDWYIDKKIPKKSKWHITCYHRSYLTPEEATELLEKMDSILNDEHERMLEKKRDKIRKGNYRKLSNNNSRHEIVLGMYELNTIGASPYLHVFNTSVYSKKHKIMITEPRDFEDFEKEMERYDLNGILKNIHLYIDSVEGKISSDEYFHQSNLYSKTKEELEAERKRQEEKVKQKRLKEEAFYSLYPKFETAGIEYNIKRQDVNGLLFKHNDNYPSFIQFQSAMKPYSTNELLEKLHNIVEGIKVN